MMYSNSFLAKASNWFLLGVILVVFLVPSMAIGTVDRSLTQEGDPGDGMDYGGGGGAPGGSVIEGDQVAPPNHDHVADARYSISIVIVGVWSPQYRIEILPFLNFVDVYKLEVTNVGGRK